MKLIIPILLAISLTGCTTATNYTKAEFEANDNQAPKMFLGMMKVYPGAAAKILSTPMIATKPASSTYIYTTTTIKDNKGNTTTYTTSGYVR
jgi:ABC-type uncharacterized transport system auxiliary subunit